MSAFHKHFNDPAGAGVLPAVPAIPEARPYDENWVLLSGFLILFMQFGFALVEAGSVRYKNSQSIAIKVVLGLFCTILIWWLFGYAFAFGYDRLTYFLGGTKVAGSGWEASQYENDYANYVIRYAAAAVSVSVVSGGAAERMTFLGWSILSIVYAGFIYPAIVHWTFARGWLHTFGYRDFAGAGVVFWSGGIAALVVTAFIKPRRYRFDPNTTITFPAHSPLYVGFGSLILFAGWLFFNAGLVSGGESNPYPQGLVAVNTLIAGATGGFVAFIIRYLMDESTSLVALSKGILAGLVASSACASEMRPWAAFIYGLVAAVGYAVSAKVVPKAHLDDPVEVIPVFLVNGFLGIFLTGLLDYNTGLFYGHGMGQLGKDLLGLLLIAIWVAFFVFLTLIVLKGFGVLRVESEIEAGGIDKAHCLGEALEFHNQSLYRNEAPATQKVEISSQRLRGSQVNLARSGFR